MRYRSSARSGAGRPPVRQIIGLGLCVSLLLTHPLHASSDQVTRGASLDAEQRCVHVVSSGESIERIARRYSTTRRALITRNRLVSLDRLRVSQRLEVPCRAPIPEQEGDGIRQYKAPTDRVGFRG